MHLPLANISILDIGTNQWYQQIASGDIPPWRYGGCSIVVSAPDHSSHSIYVFGGWGNSAGASDGNVYVLSIPSFRWIRVNQDSTLRTRHQCALAGKSAMLVVGGVHGKGQTMVPFDATGCDNTQMFTQGLGIFSLNNHTWSSDYDPSEASTTYQVHPSISAIIGGDHVGSATVQTPIGGFSQQALGALLGSRVITNTTVAGKQKNHSTTGLSAATIAGITVAAIVSAIFILLLTACLLHRRSRRRADLSPDGHSSSTFSSKIPLRKASELSASTGKSSITHRVPVELGDCKSLVHEIGSVEKPLPPMPFDLKPPQSQPQEMEGELGWHPAVRSAVKEKVMPVVNLRRF